MPTAEARVPAGNATRLTSFARFTGGVIRRIGSIVARVKVEGWENLPASGPILVICNHASNADGMLLMGWVVPRMGRRMAWLGKEEALRWPFFGWAMRQNGVFGVRRGAGDLEAFKAAKSVLDEGRILAIFPEGTRSPTGSMQAAKEGATVLAVRSGAPILPIAIEGSHRFWPKGQLIFRPRGNMTVRIGKTFMLTMPKAADRHESLRLATNELMSHIAELLPPDQRGVYGEPALPAEG